MLKRLAAAKNKAESRAGGKTIYSMEKTREAYHGRIFIKREICFLPSAMENKGGSLL